MSTESAALVVRLQQQIPAIKSLLRAGGAPGTSLGVFHNGHIVYTHHLGQRDIESPETPDDHSVYWVASTFKIVSVCAIARLVSDGFLGWDVPVHEYLPEFSCNDQLGAECTIRDLITHRTGLPMASFYWGQQKGELLSPQREFVRFVNHLPTVKPFRSTFIYSQWNFCLLHTIVEKVTGKLFGDFVRESIFEPLGLKTATFDIPAGTNIMKAHAIRNDGTARKIAISALDSSSGLAAGAGGKSSIKDQLNLYIALLAAYDHQVTNNVDTTPGSPFTQLRTIFTPHIRLPGSRIENQAYCLGLYRTQLPGNLSCASLNASLPKEQLLIFGKGGVGVQSTNEEIFHHSCGYPGTIGAMFLVPRTQSGVVVHTNATSRLDTADYSAQLLLAALLDTKMPEIVPTLSDAVVKTQLGWYEKLATFLESCRTDVPPTHPLSAYAGTYWNAIRNFKLVVAVEGSGLCVSVQGFPLTTYDLKLSDGDTFYWPANREHELVDRGMWFAPFPQWHFVKFETNEKRVLSLSWQHEKLMDAEVFVKEEDGVGARL